MSLSKKGKSSLAGYETKKLQKANPIMPCDFCDLDEKSTGKMIGVVDGDIIRRVLNPPYTRPTARVPLQFGVSVFHTPVRTMIRNNLRFVPIEHAESTDDVKQIIPFIIIVNNIDKKILLRKFDMTLDIHRELCNEYSLGLLDHINGGEGMYESLYRIVENRIGIKSKDISTCIFNGYIYDNPQHIGLVFIARIDMPDLSGKGDMWKWLSFEDIKRYVDDDLVDDWSKIAYEYILKYKHLAGLL